MSFAFFIAPLVLFPLLALSYAAIASCRTTSPTRSVDSDGLLDFR
jgi:hypothetical protein